ncbi:hypothetical protein PENCOP_c004G03984, partial [Penicillium coprophilum]
MRREPTSFFSTALSPGLLVYNHYLDLPFNPSISLEEVYSATAMFYLTIRKAAGVPLDSDLIRG